MPDWVDWLDWAAKQRPPGADDGFAGEAKVRLVLMALARHVNEHGRCHPSQEALARYLNVDRRVVRSALPVLIEVGLIADTGRKEGRSVIWQLAGPAIPRRRDNGVADGVVRLPGQAIADRVVDGVADRVVDGVADGVVDRVAESALTSANAVQKEKEKEKGEGEEAHTRAPLRVAEASLGAAETAPDPPPDGFEAFWTAYPRKERRRQAETEYRSALRHATAEQVLNGVHAYVAEVLELGRDEEFIAFPANWLRHRRWEDEPFGAPAAVDNTPTASPQGVPDRPDCPHGKPDGHLIRAKHRDPFCGQCRTRFKRDPDAYRTWLAKYPTAENP